MTNNKLYISDDAPVELKETISVAQRMVDNMEVYKIKADNGTLTFDDLDELARLNNAISDEFPQAQQPLADCPVQTRNMDDLQALSTSRLQEAEHLLKQKGGAVYEIDSLDQLKELSKMPPAAIGKIVLDAAKTAKKAKQGKKPKVKAGAQSFPKRPFPTNIFVHHLTEIQTLLYNCKLVFHNLPYDWGHVERFEEQLLIHAKSFEDFREEGITFLTEVLTGEEDGDDVDGLKGEAAFVLATIETKNGNKLNELIDVWKDHEELKPAIVRALKFGKHSSIERKLEATLLEEKPEIQADFIEILAYRKAMNPALWDEVPSVREPLIEEKTLRAYVNANLPFEMPSFDRILEDEDAPYHEDALFSGILLGDSSMLIRARKRIQESPDTVVKLPLYFSCGCRFEDYTWIKCCLEEEAAAQSAAMALGITGLGAAIPLLIRSFSDTIESKEGFDLQKRIAEALELITGARLELPMPDVVEGAEGKEHEVKVTIDWNVTWTEWWIKNNSKFQEMVRYRRGKPFDLESCILEMENPRGNYWCRQYAYYELQARSGKHIAPFYADWYVAEQKNAINQWKQWWQENRSAFPATEWLFAGKEHFS